MQFFLRQSTQLLVQPKNLTKLLPSRSRKKYPWDAFKRFRALIASYCPEKREKEEKIHFSNDEDSFEDDCIYRLKHPVHRDKSSSVARRIINIAFRFRIPSLANPLCGRRVVSDESKPRWTRETPANLMNIQFPRVILAARNQTSAPMSGECSTANARGAFYFSRVHAGGSTNRRS